MTKLPESKARRGLVFEKTLDVMHKRYWRDDKVLIAHYGISGRYFFHSGKSRFVAHPKDGQPPDYHGSVRGHLVVFDAKSTKNKTRWRLDSRYLHQVVRLRAWSASGAVAFFIVHLRRRDEVRILRVWDDGEYPAFGFDETPSFNLLLLQPNDENLFDWLPAVRDAWLPASVRK